MKKSAGARAIEVGGRHIPEEASQMRMVWSDDPDMIRFPSRVYTTAFTCGKIYI
jgi:hypothetical protein